MKKYTKNIAAVLVMVIIISAASGFISEANADYIPRVNTTPIYIAGEVTIQEICGSFSGTTYPGQIYITEAASGSNWVSLYTSLAFKTSNISDVWYGSEGYLSKTGSNTYEFTSSNGDIYTYSFYSSYGQIWLELSRNGSWVMDMFKEHPYTPETVSTEGVALVWLDETYSRYTEIFEKPYSAKVIGCKYACYVMPTPEVGNGNLGTANVGSTVTVYGRYMENADYVFIKNADGQYGWARGVYISGPIG